MFVKDFSKVLQIEYATESLTLILSSIPCTLVISELLREMPENLYKPSLVIEL